MVERFRKAFMALLVILLITLGCLAFMPWRMSEVISQLPDVYKCMVLRYENGKYTTIYPKDEVLDDLVEAIGNADGYFDRKRVNIAPSEAAPLYRIYFWDTAGRIPEVWVCGTELFYENSQYVLKEESAESVNAVLVHAFEKG